jgi:hypothetical protein
MTNADRNNMVATRMPRTDVAGLSRLIRLPYPPVRALYTTAVRGVVGLGPTDWELTALLTFDASHADVIANLAARRPRPRAALIVQPERIDWFPPETRNLLVESLKEAGFRLNGEIYDVNEFIKSPLMHGHMIRVGTTSHFYLYLFTM